MRMALPRPLLTKLTPLARTYGCDAAELVRVAVEELIAAHRTPTPPRPRTANSQLPTPNPEPSAVRPRRLCPCGQPILGRGPKKVCDACRDAARPPKRQTPPPPARTAIPPPPREDANLDVHWNGERGRQGQSLIGPRPSVPR